MAPRRKVRRTSSLPGLVSDDPTGLQATAQAAVASIAAAASSSSMTSTNVNMNANMAGSIPSTVPSVAPPPYSFTFTTNLTPTTFQHADKTKGEASSSSSTANSHSNATNSNNNTNSNSLSNGPASPANSTSSATNSRKRNADALDEFYTDQLPTRKEDQPAHTRKFSAGHIPRPPNAFILFRSDLVARKAVPTSLEADHSTISKIIGVCWRTLPAKQRKRWEQKALEAKAAHKKMYPDYRYTPVHRKGASRKKPKKEQQKDESRVESLAQLLLAGSKGADLEERMKKLDTKIASEAGPEEAAKAFQTTFSAAGDHSMMGGMSGMGGTDGLGTDSQLPHQQQFTFVQGFPAGGHTIEVPSAPNMQTFHPTGVNGNASTNGTAYQYGQVPYQPRRHSSAPPADAQFLDPTAGSSSSTASTPSTRELLLPSGKDDDATTVPLSRISRKLPTKSTHHLQPHHFHAEAQMTANAQAAGAHSYYGQGQGQGLGLGLGHGHGQGSGNGKKVKSSLSKAIRRAAQGLPVQNAATERDQLFIQSHWTSAAVSGIDPSVVLLNNGGKKKKKGVAGANGSKTAIPQDLLLPTWDLNATSNAGTSAGAGGASTSSVSGNSTIGHGHAGSVHPASSNASPVVDSMPAPHYGSPGHFSPAFAPSYPTDDKYGHYDPSQVAEGFEFYGLENTGVAPTFDFAASFGTLGVDELTEDYGYPLYQQPADLASGPTSADSTSPHTSDVEDAAAFHPYTDELTQRMPTYNTEQTYSQPPSANPESVGAMMYAAAPDWSAFGGFDNVLGPINPPTGTATTAPAVDPLDSLDSLDPLDPLAPSETLNSNNFQQFGFDQFDLPPLPASGPCSEIGDADQDGTGFDFPVGSYQAHNSPLTHHSTHSTHSAHSQVPSQQQQQQQMHQQGGRPMQLNLSMGYRYSPSAPSPATDIADQMNMFNIHTLSTPIKTAGSPVVYHSPHVTTHPHAHYPHSVPHGIPQHGMHPHHSHTLSTHSNHSVMDYHHQDPVGVTVANDQWAATAWNNPDPFATAANNGGNAGGNNDSPASGMSGGLDPLLAPGVAVDYRI